MSLKTRIQKVAGLYTGAHEGDGASCSSLASDTELLPQTCFGGGMGEIGDFGEKGECLVSEVLVSRQGRSEEGEVE